MAYQFLPVDLIPNHVFLIGYLDNVAVLLGGLVLSWIAIPRDYVDLRRENTFTSDHDQARMVLDAGLRRLAHRCRTARWRSRLLLVTLLGMLLCRPVVRLVLGRPARPSERRAFRMGLRQHHVVLPPLMRGLAAIAAARPVLTRTMLGSWLLADPTYQGQLRRQLDSRDSAHSPDRLRIWTRRPVSFLHIEKTAGTSLLSALGGQFHPGQIDPDPHRASPPHLLSPFASNAREQIRHHPLVWGHYDLPSLRRLDPDRFRFTMLRAPADRLVSLYHYWRSIDPAYLGHLHDNPQVRAAHDHDLLGFLRSDDVLIINFIDNIYARRLLGLYASAGCDPLRQGDDILRRALVALDSLDFIGITEQACRSVRRLGMLLGVDEMRSAPLLNNGADLDSRPDFRPVMREPITGTIRHELDRLTSIDSVIYRTACARFEAGGTARNATGSDAVV